MSESDETDPENPEEPEEPESNPTPDAGESDSGDDQPELTEDETASTDGLDLADAELDPEPDDDQGGDQGDDQGDDADEDRDDQGDDQADAPSESGGRWGAMYVSVLTQTTNQVIEKHGDDDSEKVDREHFEEVDLDQHFNETMEKFKGSSEMEPEQALVVGSLVGVAGPIALETNLLSELKNEIKDDDA